MTPSLRRTDLLACLGAALLLVGCADKEETKPPPDQTTTTDETTDETTTTSDTSCVPSEGPLPHKKLSEYCFFEGPLKDLAPAAGVQPYDVAAALWSDHAAKQRLIVLPKGKRITFGEGENWQYPAGTILVKTFSFYEDFRDLSTPRRTVETRLLILGESGWTGEVYLWNDEQTEATRIVAGDRADVTYIDESGDTYTEEYVIPNQNQCKSCHERDDVMTFLGPFTQQLNRPIEVGGETKNQLQHLADQGLFDAALPDMGSIPAFPDPFGDAPLDERARAYLHANCSHCHRPGGSGGPSGLVLLAWEQSLAKNGACKEPAAAGQGTGGHSYDIVPGSPDESIMVFRMSSTDPDIKMPELPNRLPDKKGVALVSDWIAAMTPAGCP